MNPLLDKEFLKELDSINHKEIFARLTSLNFIEMPIEQIEGKITGGSINLDGSSSSRRTCNLTMIAKDVNINEFYWGLTHKIKIEIGVINTIKPEYDDIIWFNQGIFIISTFNVSLSVNNYTITLNAKDKMSMLNGDLGGNLFAQTDFANIENYDDIYEIHNFNEFSEYEADKYYIRIIDEDEPDETKKEKFVISTEPYDERKIYYDKISTYSKESLTLKTIIKEMIHTYAKEPYFNIVINDLDESGVELLEYRGSEPLYLIYDIEQNLVVNMTMNGDMRAAIKNPNGNISNYDSLKTFTSEFDQSVDSLIDLSIPIFVFEADQNNPQKEYRVRKVEYGQTAGFRATDLVYVGELIGNIGETLTSVLDKIKNMLGDFEYFYDIDGRFIFQRQKTYENQSWNSLVKTDDNDLLIENAVDNSAIAYSFVDNNIITAFNNSPNLSNLRNDFSIWGIRKGVSGADIPVHLRFAIDTKPSFYKNFNGEIYYTSDSEYQQKYDAIIAYYDQQIAILEQQKQDTLDAINSYQKSPNPNNLPEEWWNVLDWAEKYKLLTGHYPTGTLSHYASSKTNFNPNDYFPDAQDNAFYHHCNSNNRPVITYQGDGIVMYSNGNSSYGYFGLYTLDRSSELSVFDVNSDGTLGYYGHGGSCSHSYSYFLDNKTICGTISYIYNPELPEADLQAFEDQIAALEEEQEKAREEALANYVICDWREIIYQMAKDYYKYNQEDNFYSTLQNNNGKKLDGSYYYPNGVTGYEQYYIDIISFWRDLYNLNPERNYQTFGGYYAEYIDWTQVNDFTYQLKTQWVGFEKDIGLFETDYFLPEDEKIYSDEDSAKIVAIKNTKIDLDGLIIDSGGNSISPTTTSDNNTLYLYNKTNQGKIVWQLDNDDEQQLINHGITVNNIYYEVYRSFYPTSGYCKVYLDSNNINTTIRHGDNHNYYVESNARPFGSVNKDLPIYYKIRGFYTITVDGEQQTIYTQWSNRINIVYHIEYDLDDLGQRIEGDEHKAIYPVDIHELPYTDSDKVPVISIVAYQNNFPDNHQYYYWNKNVFNAPEKLNFWFDFLDSDSELAQYKVSVVGDRTKAVNDTKVTSIYFKETPDIIFCTAEEYLQRERQSGYVYFKVSNEQMNLFSISSQFKSAKDVLDEFLYKFSYCVESVTITSLPVYYLEPNTRIFVYDEDSKINGEYIVSKITLPLMYNGTMSITATKAVSRIY